MYLTPDNASEYLGKKLDASTRRLHYYPLEVIQFPDGEYTVKDSVGVCSKVDGDKFNQPFFDIVDGVHIESEDKQ